MILRKSAAAAAAALTLAAGGAAQSPDPALDARLRLAEAWIERQMLDHLIPGASLAVEAMKVVHPGLG